MQKKSIGILILLLIVIVTIIVLVNYILSIPKINIIGKFDGFLSDFSITENQKIIVCGNFTKANNIKVDKFAIFDLKGKIDRNFDQKNLIEDKINLSIQKIFILDNNQYLVVYNYDENLKQKTAIAKFDSEGNKISEFSSNLFIVNAIEKQDDGKILIGGKIFDLVDYYPFHLFRLNSDLSLDYSFDTTNGFDKPVYDILYKDSKIYVAGEFVNYKSIPVGRIVRLNLDGQLDSSFKLKSGANSDIFDIDTDEKGNLYIAGMFKYFDEVERIGLARLKDDGTLDLKFKPIQNMNSVLEKSGNQEFSKSFDFLPQISKIIYDNGRVLITGNFASINGLEKFKIARITKKGRLDKSFKLSLINILKKARIRDNNIYLNANINKIMKIANNEYLISVVFPSNSLLVKVKVR